MSPVLFIAPEAHAKQLRIRIFTADGNGGGNEITLLVNWPFADKETLSKDANNVLDASEMLISMKNGNKRTFHRRNCT